MSDDGPPPPLRVWVHAGTPLAEGACAVQLDARRRGSWPALAELDVPLADLPALYEVDARAEWLDRPRPLAKRRVARLV